jgi:hypothetical protein
MKALCLSVGALLTLAGLAHAQTGFTITGSMSNFDCVNHCDYPCDEMEVQIEGIRPEDVLHTYTNGNYGAPTVTLSSDGTHTIVDYRNPQHLTNVNSLEHFGITIRGAAYYVPAPYHPTSVHWYRDGHIATVNGHVPDPFGSGSSTPSQQPSQPSITATVTPGSHGTGGVSLTVINTDPVQSIWIERSAQVTASPVTLESLMPNDPVVTNTVRIDPGPIKLAPLQNFTVSRDLIEIEEDQSVVFAAKYFQNIFRSSVDPFNPGNVDAFGPELGNVMTATQASPNLPCAHSLATIISQPASVTQSEGTRVDLRVSAHGDDLTPLDYLWLKEGVALTEGNGFTGVATSHLRIDHLTAATEGFYTVRVTNTCNSVLSDSALVFITGHNTAPVRTVLCAGDFNGLGGVTVQDIFDYLNAWFSGSAAADFNHVGGITVQDIFDFLSAWFASC